MKPTRLLAIAVSVGLAGEQLVPKNELKKIIHGHHEQIEIVRLRPQMVTTLATGDVLSLFVGRFSREGSCGNTFRCTEIQNGVDQLRGR